MRVSPLQDDFSGGEVSPLYQGRVTSELYRKCMAECENYLPTVQGPLIRRQGTGFAAEVKDSSRATRLVRFEFSTEQAYVLEFGHLYIRFYKDNAPIVETAKNITGATNANPCVITSNSHGYSNGDEVVINSVGGMTQLNGRRFIVAGVTANTFQLSGVNSSAYGTYTSGGTAERIYTKVTAYTEAQVFELNFEQSADVLYIVHSDHYPATLTRTGHTSWSLGSFTIGGGPYQAQQDAITISVVRSGAGPYTYTITASAALFTQYTNIFQTIRWKSTNWYYGYATYVSSTVVTVSHKTSIADVTGIVDFRLGVWYDGNFPSKIAFHEDRLCFSGYPDFPQRVDGSATGDYSDFEPTEPDGTIVASGAISFTINAREVNANRWFVSDEKGLLVGATGGNFGIRPSSQNEALSPTNVVAKKVNSFGSADIQPTQIGKATLFVQNSGEKLRELIYFYDVDSFQANDLTFLASHILQSGVKEMARANEPHPLVWCIRNDGVAAVMTYERDSDSLKIGWSRQILGGTSDAAGNPAEIESVAVIPSPDGTFDQVWFVVKRYINGGVKRYVEYLTQFFGDTTDQQDGVFLDCSLTLDSPVTITGATAANPVVITANSHGLVNGDTVIISDIEGMTELNTNIYTVANKTANTFELSGINGTSYTAYVSGGEVRKRVSTVTGLLHLEGQTVKVVGDGAVQTDKTVSSGSITLDTAAAVVHVGYGYDSKAKMLRIEAGSADGTALGKKRRISSLALLLHRTRGLAIGADFETMTDVRFPDDEDLLGHAPALFSGLIREEFESDTDMNNYVCLKQSDPVPGTILAIAPQMVTQDRA